MDDARVVFEEVAVGHDDVGDLALLERAEAIGGAGDPGGVDRQRADGGVGWQAVLDRARGVAHEVARLRKPPDENANSTPRLLRARPASSVPARARAASRIGSSASGGSARERVG